ncbi:MAG: LacI family DNA-binding transcriptional regulator [Verrucomicrobiae bacterium]|nr:LacI family DNA-binding transcriptional regulator [Verrucomicrobiae bacterium]
MREVAHHAGYSLTTVSMALRDHPSITTRTKERILRSQQELGYRVNRLAQEFVSNTRGRSRHLKLQHLAYCLVDRPFENPSYGAILNGVEAECRAQRLHLSVHHLPSNPGASVAGPVFQYGKMGFIVTGWVTDACLQPILKEQSPVVVVGSYDLASPVTRVESDMRSVGTAFAAEVIASKRRHPVFVVQDSSVTYAVECLDAVRFHFQRSGVDPRCMKVISVGYGPKPGTTFIEAFQRLDPTPDCVIVLNIRVADDCFMKMSAHGLRVGKDHDLLALVVSEHQTRLPGYRVLNGGMERCGRLAVQRLIDLVEKRSMSPCRIALPVMGWVESPTTGIESAM